MALCTYYLDRCNSNQIIDMIINHQFALIKWDGKWEKIESSRNKETDKTSILATKCWKYTFDPVPDLIAIVDDKYRIVRANKAMAARLEVTPEECVGLTCYRVVHGTAEPPSFCPHRQFLKDGLEHTIEVHEDRLGGDFLLSSLPLHDSEGKLTGCIHIACDITERKKTEKVLLESEVQLTAFLEQLPVGIELVDTQGIRVVSNSMFRRFVNAGIPLLDLDSNSHRRNWGDAGRFLEQSERPSERALRGENVNPGLDFLYTSDDGLETWTRVGAVPFRNEAGEITGAIGIIQDIDKQKRTEEELLRKEEELNEAQRIAHVGSWYWDGRTDNNTVSDELLRIFGQVRPPYQEKQVTTYSPESWESLNMAAQTLQT
jgi:PAS domain S-box-containing protein